MSLWLVRAGRAGEHEERFFGSNRIYLTWKEMADRDLSGVADYEGVKQAVRAAYPDLSERRAGNWAGQIWAFALAMKPGDWVAVPHKTRPAVAFAELEGTYQYDPSAEPLYRHWRAVRWLNQDVPRSALDPDLLFSFGSLLTICQVKRNDADNRVRALARAGWKPSGPVSGVAGAGKVSVDTEGEAVDLERLARDQIARLVIQKFQGHGLARLVNAVLRAQGYTTYLSPEGPDKGIDLLAAPGPLGFGRPRLCVQVKSGDSPADLPTLNQLIGAMQNVQAEQGLLVCWGGFKASVERELPAQFFRVRLWDQDELIAELLEHYDRLDADLRAELPLKRVWTLAVQDEGE